MKPVSSGFNPTDFSMLGGLLQYLIISVGHVKYLENAQGAW